LFSLLKDKTIEVNETIRRINAITTPKPVLKFAKTCIGDNTTKLINSLVELTKDFFKNYWSMRYLPQTGVELLNTLNFGLSAVDPSLKHVVLANYR